LSSQSHAGIVGGKAVVQGTRLAVDLLPELVDAGLRLDDLLREYPPPTREDVLMVLQVARKAHETIRYERLKSATES